MLKKKNKSNTESKKHTANKEERTNVLILTSKILVTTAFANLTLGEESPQPTAHDGRSSGSHRKRHGGQGAARSLPGWSLPRRTSRGTRRGRRRSAPRRWTSGAARRPWRSDSCPGEGRPSLPRGVGCTGQHDLIGERVAAHPPPPSHQDGVGVELPTHHREGVGDSGETREGAEPAREHTAAHHPLT